MSQFEHLELHTGDTEAAKKFYGRIFGWKFNEMPMPGGSYCLIEMGEGGPGGGIVKKDVPDM